MRTLGVRKWALTLFIVLPIVGVAAADTTGNWAIEVTYDNPRVSGGTINCALKQEGRQLSGYCGDVVTLSGEVKGENVGFIMRSKDTPPWTTTFTGSVNEAGTVIAGTFRFTDQRGRFTASKRS